MTSRRALTAALALTLSLGTAAAPALAAVPTAPVTSGSDAELEQLVQQLQAIGVQPALPAQQLAGLVNGSDYECSSTELGSWLGEQLDGWDDTEVAFAMLAAGMVAEEAIQFQPEGPQSIGANGEYTKEVEKTLRSLQGFWDVDGSDIRVGAMHGDVLMDDDRMLRLFARFRIPAGMAELLLDDLQAQLQQPKFDGGNHPVFTVNAFAYDSPGADQPDKIIIGDGILEGMEAIGLGDVAPRGILAHEYGHHVQYELGLMGPYDTSPEATRELELEADALAGYYLSHPRGERLRQQRVDAFVRSFGETGDCGFHSNSHHGTPNQRVAAGRWADALANAQGAKGHILPARTVSDRFRAVLPEILAPDAR